MNRKRILFVDDEAMILQGLQRLLRSQRHEWDMEFFEDGTEALELAAKMPFDVVVADMVMPNMSGAELLDKVHALSPHTVRLILSGQADQHLAVKCLGVAHQYLSKPCDAESLKRTITRLTSHEFLPCSQRVLELLPRLERLPCLPTAYSRMVQLLNQPDTSLDDVAAVVAQDVGLVTHILKLVNSSFFGLPRRISQPAEAASYLGVEALKSVVLATEVFAQFEDVKSFSIEAFVQHSQRVGAAARLIARCQNARQMADESLTAGLLHDVGKLVFAANVPELYDQAIALAKAQRLAPEKAEQAVIGVGHAEVAGYLLGLWGLPPLVVEAIGLHHSPDQSPTQTFSALTAVHVANGLVHEQALSPALSRTGVDIHYLESLGVSDSLPRWREMVRQSLVPSNRPS